MQERSDAFVFFGATGDLAYKKIFPALQAMIRRGHLDVPIIGVAKAGWTLEQLRERARASVTRARRSSTRRPSPSWSALLRYVDGDYGEPATFDALRRELGDAARPIHYLAIPPSMFPVVVESLGASGCAQRRARRRREAVRPRSRLGASAQRDAAHGVPRAGDLPHRPLPRQGAGAEPRCSSASPTRSSSRSGTATTSRACRSRWPRASASRAAAASTRRPARSATSCRTTCCRWSRCSRWSRRPRPTASRCATRRPRCSGTMRAARRRPSVVRGQFDGYRKEPGVAADSEVETFAALRLEIDSWRWAGVPFFIRAGKCLPVTATEVIVELQATAAHDARRRAAETTCASASAPEVDDRRWGARQEAGRGDGRRADRADLVHHTGARRDGRRTSGCSATRCTATRRCSRARTRVEAAWAIVEPDPRRRDAGSPVRARHLGPRRSGAFDGRHRRLVFPYVINGE